LSFAGARAEGTELATVRVEDKEDAVRDELRGTVLCVDDDEGERHALAWVFEAAGLEVEQAATGGCGRSRTCGTPGW
jgi:hypothetical protein